AKLHQRLDATIIYVTHDQTEAMTLGTRIIVMKDGVIQQVDTPQNLYDRPVNLFVAGFMGSPQMNFIECEVKEVGGRCELHFVGRKVTLQDARSKKLIEGGYVGKKVILGIRPEDIKDEQVAIESLPDSTFEAEIRVYELLGAEVFLYFTLEDKNNTKDLNNTVDITARVNPRTTARVGDTIKIAFDLSKIHLFDKESEAIICH
ncbi:MAG: ABC transporter ATP-binding protein, partial [Lachnospiraceae bacterium]|nr:ABC transporter ATP-binding protein [Lachnospiraceae bacterium]